MKIFVFLLLLLAGPGLFAQENAGRYPVIPKPLDLVPAEGEFNMDRSVKILASPHNAETRELTGLMSDFLSASLGKKIRTGKGSETPEQGAINIIIDESILRGNPHREEGYQLSVSPETVTIRAASPAGAFWGFQTLRQLLPASGEQLSLPAVEIEDAPRFGYRGLHLDVGRHFFPVAFIKKYIDLLASYKLNTFHWHLTEDQGWRIEIKKYPKLQEIAAYRDETLIGHYGDQPHQFDGKRYGGYYTQKEVKEVVEYARQRQVTVIPEIELPGHSLAALSAYPEIGCTGGPYKAATKWGVFDDIYCAGNEETFEFLENVLTEVMELFPSKYIHIGGDEAPKARWKTCPKCQKRIKEEGLEDEHELQSYFIGRIEKFLNAHGRQIIGWDEILEGGLAPNATVMSWRGIEGGVEAARQGHDVIMTPNGQLYLDHYQSKSPGEPVAIGGYTTVKDVYEYEPVPDELNEQQAGHVLGAQGNVWTEYMKTPEHVEYMVYPRAIALSEIVWTKASLKDYAGFTARLKHHLPLLEVRNVHYAGHVFDVQAAAETDAAGMRVKLWSEDREAAIYYTLDGSEPDQTSLRYKEPFLLKESATVKAVRVLNGKPEGNVFQQTWHVHKAAGKKIELAAPPHDNYRTGGPQALVDGLQGSSSSAEGWLGWSGAGLDAEIDLGKVQEVGEITLRFANSAGQWIYPPRSVEIQLSYDGFSYTPFYENREIGENDGKTVELRIPVNEGNIRYIKVIAENYGKIPEGAPGAGRNAWLFADEIIVN